MENFDLVKIKGMCAIDAKEYLKKYFVPLNDGNHAFYENGKYTIKEQKVIKSTYFNRMSKELNEFYFRDYCDIKTITYQINKPAFFNSYLNLCPEISAKNDTPYNEHSEAAKNGVQQMLQFIKEVLASDSEDSYNYLVKWISNMVKGNKNDSCLYLKGEQGIGKSTFTDFLKYHVTGMDLMLETGSEPLKSKFNSILGGKLLVVFEELENFSTNEWSAVSSILKRYITSNIYTLESKNCNPYSTSNMNNYIINSNNDAIKDDDGRRYFILDISHKYQGNMKYFGNLKSNCFNDDVGKAFYSYMLEVNTDGFVPQMYPMTQSKINAFAKRLDKVFEFIKQAYVLPKQKLNITSKDLYEEYKAFCNTNGIKIIDKTSMFEKLERVGIEQRKTKGNNYYVYSVEALLEIAQKRKWVNDYDTFEDASVDTDTDWESIMMEKDEQIKQMKSEIEALKAQLQIQDNQKDLIEELF